MSRIGLFVLTCIVLVAVACGSSSTSSSTNTVSSAAATVTSGLTSAATTPASSTATTSSASPAPDATVGTATAAVSNPSESGSATVYRLVSGKNMAQYEAHEKLAFLTSPSAAVGKTLDVSGSLAFTASGAIDKAKSKITVDLSTLTSDKSMRDHYIKQNTLETDTFPDAVLVPTSVQGLTWPLPSSGQATFTLIGNLTVHGVTKQTSWQVTATFGSQQVSGTATTTVKFEDFGMTPPTTMIALSVQDSLKLQIDFVVQKAS